jgi:hypothetical protein
VLESFGEWRRHFLRAGYGISKNRVPLKTS